MIFAKKTPRDADSAADALRSELATLRNALSAARDAFEAQLPVLDLGDVGELGGQTGNSAQRRAVFELHITRGR